MDNKKPWTDAWRNAVAANMANAEPLPRRDKVVSACAIVVTALLLGFVALVVYVAL